MENKTPNMSIHCSVSNCVHNCREKEYCSLSSIQVGTHEADPKKVPCTDCQSFKATSTCTDCGCNI